MLLTKIYQAVKNAGDFLNNKSFNDLKLDKKVDPVFFTVKEK